MFVCLFDCYCFDCFTLFVCLLFSPFLWNMRFLLFMANYKMIMETLCLFAQLSLFDVLAQWCVERIKAKKQKKNKNVLNITNKANERAFYVDEMVLLYDDDIMNHFNHWFVLLNQDICILTCRRPLVFKHRTRAYRLLQWHWFANAFALHYTQTRKCRNAAFAKANRYYSNWCVFFAAMHLKQYIVWHQKKKCSICAVSIDKVAKHARQRMSGEEKKMNRLTVEGVKSRNW